MMGTKWTKTLGVIVGSATDILLLTDVVSVSGQPDAHFRSSSSSSLSRSSLPQLEIQTDCSNRKWHPNLVFDLCTNDFHILPEWTKPDLESDYFYDSLEECCEQVFGITSLEECPHVNDCQSLDDHDDLPVDMVDSDQVVDLPLSTANSNNEAEEAELAESTINSPNLTPTYHPTYYPTSFPTHPPPTRAPIIDTSTTPNNNNDAITLDDSTITITTKDDPSSEQEPDISDILEGENAPVGRYPYMVSLQDSDGLHRCGGTLIAKDIILSAQHCYQDPSYVIDSIVINRYNYTDSSTGQVIAVEDARMVLLDPAYNAIQNGDYLVYVLKEPTTQDVTPIRIYDNDPETEVPAIIAGWGVYERNPDTVSEVLQQADTVFWSREMCYGYMLALGFDSYFPTLDDFTFVCGYDDVSRTCYGDSGGPLIIPGDRNDGSDDVQVGLLSWGIADCGEGYPSAFTSTMLGYAWIEDIVCGLSQDVPKWYKCNKRRSKSRKLRAERVL